MACNNNGINIPIQIPLSWSDVTLSCTNTKACFSSICISEYGCYIGQLKWMLYWPVNMDAILASYYRCYICQLYGCYIGRLIWMLYWPVNMDAIFAS